MLIQKLIQPVIKLAKSIRPIQPVRLAKHAKPIKNHHLALAAIPILFASIFATITNVATPAAHATSCPDLKIIFARGSGAERDVNDDYLEFKRVIEQKIFSWGITHDYLDLPYEAKGIGVNNLTTILGAFFGAGDAYDFGASVDNGVDLLIDTIKSCLDTKFVLGGYSQGAMVISQAIRSIDPSRVIYAATFGDPKLYLPEGKAWFALSGLAQLFGLTESEKNFYRTGAIPAACKGENLSEYRAYVPDCYAYEGILGSYRPYQPKGYSGKLGTWCNKYDILCSSYFSITSHISYVADQLYEDASRVIAAKVAEAFGIKNTNTSLHDTAILIDSTGSMGSLINHYKAEAKNLAEKTLAAGGRVALYDYRDLAEEYTPVEHCNFDTCTLETFQAGLDAIVTTNGGDTPESLLSASLHVMQSLSWRLGSTKSLVILTDAGYHSPDLDGTTFYDVQKLSKQIDPVNFYIITKSPVQSTYQSLAEATGGAVISSTDDLGLLTDSIMARYDSLPRVEEEFDDEEYDTVLPVLEITSLEHPTPTSAKITFKTNGTKVLVALENAILGATVDTTLTITDLDPTQANTLTLVPLTDTRRGESVTIDLSTDRGSVTAEPASVSTPVTPKAPNTGRR